MFGVPLPVILFAIAMALGIAGLVWLHRIAAPEPAARSFRATARGRDVRVETLMLGLGILVMLAFALISRGTVH